MASTSLVSDFPRMLLRCFYYNMLLCLAPSYSYTRPRFSYTTLWRRLLLRHGLRVFLIFHYHSLPILHVCGFPSSAGMFVTNIVLT